ncbi:uncharacterized protein PAC_07567 [Phialocephala subalpina]|uniref:Heterokaryon incompatibility domain-containing protein n=1 Tax=Phialocephala subalpina TaxID=576137 RepID=A0A1L7WY37_9HELO|nr:uncharacterized protein PAC_07567 [Phialocephala subalpina]
MLTEPLSNCKPYTYVLNTRGNPLAWLGINIDGHKKFVTRNIAIFLIHIQSRDVPQRLWFRDVCLNHQDPEEKARYWNQEWMDTMIHHAEKVIDLSEVMAEQWDKGRLERPFPPTPRAWNDSREPKETKHHPCPLWMQKGWVDPPPAHEYLPLDYVCDEFRLITLWKAENYDDPLRASLAYSVMHDNVTYHCLSYTWGRDEEPTYPILLNGQMFKIRQNLDLALRKMRHTVNKIAVWIDAPDGDGNWGPYNRKEGDEWKITPIPDLPRRLAALYRFFLRPYFRRIWVIQELAVAALPSLLCGKKQAAWRNLDTATYHLIDILHRSNKMPAQMIAADPALASVSDREISFIRRLFYFRHLRSKNADDLFGNNWTGIRDTSPGILDANIICAAEPSDLDAPAWTADWNTPSKVSSLIRHTHIPNVHMSVVPNLSGPIYSASGPSSLNLIPRFSFSGPVLKVAGIILDTVKIVQQKAEGAAHGDFINEWLSTAANETQTPEENEFEELNTPYMQKFWSMLAGNSTGVWSVEPLPREEWPPGVPPDLPTSQYPFRPACVQEDKCKYRMQNASADVFSIVTRGRALIITENGLMGLAPHYVEVGQKLAILSRCSVPVLLEENGDGTYGFRGASFVQGWMEGEVLEEMGLDCEEAWEVLDEGGRLRIV